MRAPEQQPDSVAGAAVRIVAGSPCADELAAVVAVLGALAGRSSDDAQQRVASRWAAPAVRLRTAYGPAQGGWRGSALPR